MRKSSWIILTVLFVAIAAPAAHADGILTLTTTPGPTVMLGGTLSDTATLSGGITPTGTLTFEITNPNNGFKILTVVVNGDGTYGPVTITGAIVIGTYTWDVTYSGDSNNAPIGPLAEFQVMTPTVPEPTSLVLTLIGFGSLGLVGAGDAKAYCPGSATGHLNASLAHTSCTPLGTHRF